MGASVEQSKLSGEIKALKASLRESIARLEERISSLETPDRDMDRKQAALSLNISPRMLKDLEYRHELIPTRRGRRVVYTQRQLDEYRAWLESKAKRLLSRS